MRSLAPVTFGLLLVLFVGCVSSDERAIGDARFDPRPDDWPIDVYVGDEAPVEVFENLSGPRAASSLPADALRIGRVDAEGGRLASWESLVDDARERARALGGDALLVHEAGPSRRGKAIAFWVIRFPRSGA